MRISDWSSDVCSSDLGPATVRFELGGRSEQRLARDDIHVDTRTIFVEQLTRARRFRAILLGYAELLRCQSSDSFLGFAIGHWVLHPRSEEHTSELQSLMRSSYAVFCLNKQKIQ